MNSHSTLHSGMILTGTDMEIIPMAIKVIYIQTMKIAISIQTVME